MTVNRRLPIDPHDPKPSSGLEPETPSLPCNRVGMVQLPHLQGFLACGEPEFAENRGHVRPFVACLGNARGRESVDLQELLRAL